MLFSTYISTSPLLIGMFNIIHYILSLTCLFIFFYIITIFVFELEVMANLGGYADHDSLKREEVWSVTFQLIKFHE